MSKQLFFEVIYSRSINYLLRTLTRPLGSILPEKYKIPPVGTITIPLKERKIRFNVNQTNYFGTIIFWHDFRSFEYTSIFTELIKEIGCFIDIGANIGYYSLIAAGVNPTVRVISFEPSTGPLVYFRRNVVLNQFDERIRIESMALAGVHGEVDFYEMQTEKYHYPGFDHDLSGESNAGSLSEGRKYIIKKVPSTTLDQYCLSNSLASVDLIKIDTEGTEHQILNKGDEVIRRFKPIIICETLFQTIEKELEDILRRHGYEFYNHVPEGLKRVETLVRAEDNLVRNCFFVHPSKKGYIRKFIV